jgi:2-methylcitrate dehydratase
VIVNINTTDGRSFHKQLDYPKGDPRNPLTDQEVEEKFSALAEGVLSSGAQKRVKEAVWNLERVGSVSELMALMEADVRKTKTVTTKTNARSRARGQKRRKPVLA